MSGRGAVLSRRNYVEDEYALDTSKSYQLIFVKNDEGDSEKERRELFEERVQEAISNGYSVLGSPAVPRKYSDYELIQGVVKYSNNNNNNASQGGRRKTRRNRH